MAEPGPDRDKLRDKIQFIRSEVAYLEEIRDRGHEAFSGDRTLEYAATRSIQVAVEAMLDAANHIVAREGLGTPKTYREAVQLLVDAGVLPRDKADTFAKMVRFRNRAVHLYDEIDADEIWAIMESDLDDFEAFIRAITGRYFRPDAED